MSKPLYWIVFVPGQDSKRFTSRSAARVYRVAQLALGRECVIKAVGF